jgi:hypothetical protein
MIDNITSPAHVLGVVDLVDFEIGSLNTPYVYTIWNFILSALMTIKSQVTTGALLTPELTLFGDE